MSRASKQINNSFYKGNGQFIDLYRKDIDDEAFKLILKKNVSAVKNIILEDNNLTFISISQMIKPKWENLQQLTLTQNKIGDKGCKYLSKVNMPKLQCLWLQKSDISKNGVSHLTKAEWLNLYLLNLESNKLSTQSIAYLTKNNFIKLNKMYLCDIDLNIGEMFNLVFSKSQSLKYIDLRKNLQDRNSKQESDYQSVSVSKFRKCFREKGSVDMLFSI